MAKSKLGKGLDILIPQDFDKTILEEDKNRIQKLLIQDIIPNPEQPRREFDELALRELAESIKQFGVLQPVIVVRHGKSYKLIAGERRWRAAKAARLTHIPAIVRSLEELEQVELALIENIQRIDLSPLEQALSVYRLQQQFNMTLDQIAKRLGKAQTTLSNLTRLLQLPEAARDALRDRKISEGHARAILALKNHPDKQMELLRCVLDNRWSVRRAEEFVIDFRKQLKKEPIDRHKEFADRLGRKLGLRVQIKRKSKGGQIIIPFADEQELKSLSAKFDI